MQINQFINDRAMEMACMQLFVSKLSKEDAATLKGLYETNLERVEQLGPLNQIYEASAFNFRVVNGLIEQTLEKAEHEEKER